MSVGTQVRADYVYDALERMALRTTQNMTPSGTTHYVHDRDGHLLVEATDTGTAVREYVWLDDMPLAVVADVDTSTPKLWFVHADHLDRPVRMTDDTKAVVGDAVYRPFGEVHAITGSASNKLRFPGQYFLIEAGLHYNWHRHYDPTIGRYLQPDPLEFAGGASVYAYARSAPKTHVDPDGQNPIAIPIALCLRFPALCVATAKAAADACIATYRAISGTGGGGGGPDDECVQEIRRARAICTEAYADGWDSEYDVGPYKKPDGSPWTIQDCMRGLISERCGGNRIEK